MVFSDAFFSDTHRVWLVAGDALGVGQDGAGHVQLREKGQQGKRQGNVGRDVLVSPEDTFWFD